MVAHCVKGAYWDAEIQACPSHGPGRIPVCYRKACTDVVVPVCSTKLMNMTGSAFTLRFRRPTTRTPCRRFLELAQSSC